MRNLHLELSPIQHFLEALHAELQGVTDGTVANYIPELGRANPDWLGIALATVDGHVYQVGDSRQPFTIQSISKAITYGLALEDRGLDVVLGKVGVEPSGEAFNSISLEPETGRPLNPMINAGAIATTGLITDGEGRARMDRILAAFSRYTGRAMEIDDTVYRSESDTGHRNRAIAHLLYGHGILDRSPEEVTDLYFRQCSILVTARDLALMGACLANGGVNPVTGVVALKSVYVEKVLSVMSSCGMYDYSGSWIFHVGMPAKSGVGGGIMAVLPGQFGLGVFSPRLDAKGNSVRGIEVCKRLSNDYSLHLFKVARATSTSVIRQIWDGSKFHSRRRRRHLELDLLKTHGGRIRIYELHGELKFASTESVMYDILSQVDDLDYLILDMKRVVEVDSAAAEVLSRCVVTLARENRRIFFTQIGRHHRFRKWMEKRLPPTPSPDFFYFEGSDQALEWCEEQVIETFGGEAFSPVSRNIREQYLCSGMTEDEVETLQRSGREVVFHAGDLALRSGDKGDSFYLILEGEVEVLVSTAMHHALRLTTLYAGMCMGEVSMLNNHTRTADVKALTETRCIELNFNSLDEGIQAKLMANLARQLAQKVGQDAYLFQQLAS